MKIGIALKVSLLACLGTLACEERTEGPYTTKETAIEERSELRPNVGDEPAEEANERAELRTGHEQAKRDNRIDLLAARVERIGDRFDAADPMEAKKQPFESLEDEIEEKLDVLDDRYGELDPKPEPKYSEDIDEVEKLVASLEAMVPGEQKAADSK